MTFIKPKSMIVAIVSSIVISAVLMSTLIGYYMYVELRARDEEKAAVDFMRSAQSRIFSKYVDVSQLSSEIASSGPLKGKPVIKGIVSNRSARRLSAIVVKVKFLDVGEASIYEVVFQPLEPAFGIDQLGPMTMSYLTGASRNALEANSSRAFKHIIQRCPRELFHLLSQKKGKEKTPPRRMRQWSGGLVAEVISVGLSSSADNPRQAGK